MFVNTFIRRPVLATVCSLIIVLLGIVSATALPIDYYPEVTPPQVLVRATYTGASAEVVESAVTNILEQRINGVAGMKYITSVSSSDGSSQITTTFDASRDLDEASIDVQNRISQVEAQLPDNVIRNGIVVEKSGGSNIIQFVSISTESGEYDTSFLSNYTDLFIRDTLRRIPGVSNVQIFGERRYAMRIWLDPNKLATRGLTSEDVVGAIRSQNIQVAAGQVGRPPANQEQLYQLNVLAEGRLETTEEFSDIILKADPDGALVKLKDVARIELGADSYDTSFQFNDRDAVGIGITALSDANTLQIAQQVRERMAELAVSFPPGMVYRIPYDTSKFITSSVREVIQTLIQAIFLVVVVIFVFLQDWRITLIPTITIPVSLMGAFIFMRFFGFSINTLTMFGITLATGLVVDDAIVVVENITRYIREEGLPPFKAAAVAMQEIVGAVIATTLVLFAVFLPVAFFPGTSGKIYQQFALTIVFAVGISTFNALTLAPALSALIIQPQFKSNWFLGSLEWVIALLTRIYRVLLAFIVKLRYLVVLFFIGCLGLTYLLFQLVPSSFVPVEDQGYFITFIQGPPGVSLNYTQQVIEKATSVLRQKPEIEDTVAVGGFSFNGLSPSNALIFSTLKPWDERLQYEQTASGIVNGLFGPFLGGISDALVIPIEPPPIQGLGTAGGFQFQLQGKAINDFDTLEQVSKTLFFVGNQQPAMQINPPTFSAGSPQLNVRVDREKAEILGVPPLSIFNTLQTLLGSTFVNNFDTFNRNYRVYVQADQAFRDTPEDINQFYVRSQTTQDIIPLSNLVDVDAISGPSIINHYNLFRSVELQGSASPGFSSGQAINAMEQVATQVLPRDGMGYEWTGISLEEIESSGQAVIIFGLGLAFVFLILAAQYESYIDPFIILLAVPLAILGALSGQYWRGLQNDIFCQVGLVMLIGLASKNSILIVEFANQLRSQGLTIVKAAVDASVIRFRAILMTAFSFILGVLPLALATGAGSASRQSLGTAVVGGMLVATLLSLFIVPVLYIVIKSVQDWIVPHRQSMEGEASSLEELPLPLATQDQTPSSELKGDLNGHSSELTSTPTSTPNGQLTQDASNGHAPNTQTATDEIPTDEQAESQSIGKG